MPPEPTSTQLAVLHYCRAYWRANDQLPPTREIARHFRWSSQNAAMRHMRELVKKGLLAHNKNGKFMFPRK